MRIEDFSSKGPLFLPEEYLVGHLEGWGVLESFLGHLKKRFTITAEGSLDPTTQGVRFRETWSFDDGFTDSLSWQIEKRAHGTYTGRETRTTADAVGEQAGCAFRWRYTRDTPQKDGASIKLNFDDWFYLIDPTVCIVRGSAGRLGLPFAVAHVTYRKSDYRR